MLPNKEWRDMYHLFTWEGSEATPQFPHHGGEWFLFKTEDVENQLHELVLSYNVPPSISAFIRGFAELKPRLKQVRERNPFQIEDELELTQLEFSRIPSDVAKRRYQVEPEFRTAVDKLWAGQS